MRFRKLRIAWSGAWGIIAVLLCVLWVRGYWYADHALFTTVAKSRDFMSQRGRILCAIGDYPPGKTETNTGWFFPHIWIGDRSPEHWQQYDATIPIWGHLTAEERSDLKVIVVPIWFLIMVCGTLSFALLPVARWRFSLRTLLIAMTLVAVVLGLVVCLLSP